MSRVTDVGPAPSVADERGVFRLALGAWLGLFAGVIAVVLPSTAIFLSVYAPGGFLTLGAGLFRLVGLLVLGGAILFVLSLFLYRRGFAAFRRVEGEFALASVLCLVGSVGFLLLLVTAAVLAGSAGSVVDCVHGQPTHALSCLESNQPLGAYAGVLGFVFGWLGGLGIVVGLTFAGSRFDEPALRLGAFFYLGLLVLLIAPTLALVAPFEGAQFLLVVVPVLTVAAPALVLVGTVPRLGRFARPS